MHKKTLLECRWSHPVMLGALAATCFGVAAPFGHGATFDITSFGATGGDDTLDTAAINAAIESAVAAGGGTVTFPAGRYVVGSIRLRSHIGLHFEPGSILEATPDHTQYDPPEPNVWGDEHRYQDFGHSHWHNSLIWGEDLEDIAITGSGMIYGKGLTRGLNQRDNLPREIQQNKSIALKNCRNVTMRDFTVLHGGHFAIIGTGVDNWTIDNLRIDTRRDGIDVDCCVNVRISNCTINSPHDDAIVLKSSYALGYARATENVTISNCQVSGYDTGTLLDGTYLRTAVDRAAGHEATGRIKFGTESNGGFRNITISNCVFDYCRGFAFETVDGGVLEDVTVSNITMRDVDNAPFFLRLGARMRGPDHAAIGRLRRINIDNVVAYNVKPEYSAIISGIPGHEIEDISISNVRIYSAGGGTAEQAAQEPDEQIDAYPEPNRFKPLPAHGFYIRHARRLKLSNIQIFTLSGDERPAFFLRDVEDVTLSGIDLTPAEGVPSFVLKDVRGFSLVRAAGLPDIEIEATADTHL